MKAKGLDQLKVLHRQVKAVQAAAMERARLQREAEMRAERERALFAHSIGNVTPLKPDNRTRPPPPRISARPHQRELDDQAALRESISDDFDVESLLEGGANLVSLVCSPVKFNYVTCSGVYIKVTSSNNVRINPCAFPGRSIKSAGGTRHIGAIFS